MSAPWSEMLGSVLRWRAIIALAVGIVGIVAAAFGVFGPPAMFAGLTFAVLIAGLIALWSSVRSALSGPEEGALDLETAAPERAALLEQKNALLIALKDIENERQLGKLSDADHQRLEASYRARAKEILARLDDDLGVYLDRARALAGDVALRGRPYEAKKQDEAEAPAVASPLAEKLARLPEDKRKQAEAYLARLAAETHGDAGGVAPDKANAEKANAENADAENADAENADPESAAPASEETPTPATSDAPQKTGTEEDE